MERHHVRVSDADPADAAYAGTLSWTESDLVLPWTIRWTTDGKRACPGASPNLATIALTPHQNYQYRAFGMPGLGFKRGLGDDLVVAPYASSAGPTAATASVMDNLERLPKWICWGSMASMRRLTSHRRGWISDRNMPSCATYMVHHQGMISLSLVNYLRGERMVNRFHADPRIHSAELLLQEQIPYTRRLKKTPMTIGAVPSKSASRRRGSTLVGAGQCAFPQAHYLSNGPMAF